MLGRVCIPTIRRDVFKSTQQSALKSLEENDPGVRKWPPSSVRVKWKIETKDKKSKQTA